MVHRTVRNKKCILTQKTRVLCSVVWLFSCLVVVAVDGDGDGDGDGGCG